MSTETAREELARTLGAAYGSQDWMVTLVDRKAAGALVSAGYRIPKILGYVLVDERGNLRNGSWSQTRNEAKEQAEWLNSSRISSSSPEYRVAEIVEPTA